MTDFTLGNDSCNIQVDESSSRSVDPISCSPDSFSKIKLETDQITIEFNSTNNQTKKMESEELETNKISNDFNEININRFGKTYPYLFVKGEPIIVIGPCCKIKFI